MIRLLPFAFLFLSAVIPRPTHDLLIGSFSIRLDDEARLDCTLDRHNLEDAVKNLYKLEAISEHDLESYIREKLIISFNGVNHNLNIDSLYSDAQNTHFFSRFEVSRNSLKNIRVYNSCLIDEVPDQTNVVYVLYDDKRRGFRMHKDRFVIDIALD